MPDKQTGFWQSEGVRMVKLFLDTDFGPDCDDAGALQLAHFLCDAGEAELLGVTHCTGNPYGLPAISALNRFNGREVPLGTTKRDFLSEYQKYNRPMSEMFPHEFQDGRPQRDAVEVFREVMDRQEDGSVTVCSIGPMNNLADFLVDEQCRQLIERKVIRLVSMAGNFTPGASAEWNVEMDVSAARRVTADWPGEIVFCPWECGANVLTGMVYRGWESVHPAACAYDRWSEGGMARPSWDLLAVLYAVRGEHELLGQTGWGRIIMDERGATRFDEVSDGWHAFIVNRREDGIISRALENMLGVRVNGC